MSGLEARHERVLTGGNIWWLRAAIALLVVCLALFIAMGHPGFTAGPVAGLAYLWWTLAPAQRASVRGRKPTKPPPRRP